ncbi:transglutaminase-like domain-containing protein [Marinomonas balearica]|uniref:Transglutaminase superfamily protein n=1 Tax=Marinomonas balearica TaxID=491947 RepID=A0A4R6MJT6_9GAMM|nr:transglutaminase family protein [Marinomonas balearica]TDP01211.1 transglutaminase superfamily protein [Marinomonas balearica]
MNQVSGSVEDYLAESIYIDWRNPNIVQKAKALAKSCDSELEVVKRCFEFVRDCIRHSWDYKANPVTCKASDVLESETGYCYAKSHLLAALLRANGVPAGLCYQRITITDDVPPFCLHGLNAVYLKEFGWYRMDARGNKEGVNAQCIPPIEQLAFPIKVDGEYDCQEIHAEPLEDIVAVLTSSKTYLDVAENLPDIAE